MQILACIGDLQLQSTAVNPQCMQEFVPAHACVSYCCFAVYSSLFLLCAWFLFLDLYSI